MKTFVIAEAGSNHNRSFEKAIELIDVAKKADATAVKFQTASAETLYAANTPPIAGTKNVRKLIKEIEIPREWQLDLKKHCDSIGIEFMSTPFDERAVDQLYDLGVKRFKIAGFEATDPRFVKYVASTGLPMIISLGIGTSLKTIDEINSWIFQVNKTPDVSYLHCNNAYPTPFEDINLGQMLNISKKVKKVGLSDHTEGILIPPVAVSLGAKIIEKHYTLDRKLPGPDHSFAIEPHELSKMIINIKKVELSIKNKSEEYTDSEKKFSTARRSVVSKIDLKVGDILTEDNITTMRPLLQNSIPAADFYKILGKRVVKPIKSFYTVSKECIE